MEIQEASNCPFCNSDYKDLALEGNPRDRKGWIMCNNCGAEGPVADLNTLESEIELWNCRNNIPSLWKH